MVPLNRQQQRRDRHTRKLDGVHLAPWRLHARYYFFPLDDLKIRSRLDPTSHASLLRPRFDWFGLLSLVVVLLNLVALALYDPTGTRSPSLNRSLNNLELFFIVFFIFETAMRIVSLGMRAVFTKPWNIFDVFVAIASVIALILQSAFPELIAVSGIRAVRVLRPLRAFSRITEIRVVVNVMVKSLRCLSDVGVFYILFVVAISCAGMAVFSGELQGRCVRNEFFAFDTLNGSYVQSLAASAMEQASRCTALNAASSTPTNTSGSVAAAHEAVLDAALQHQALAAVAVKLITQLRQLSFSNATSPSYLPVRANWTVASLIDPLFVLSLLSGDHKKSSFVCGALADSALHRIQLAAVALADDAARRKHRHSSAAADLGDDCEVYANVARGVSDVLSRLMFSIEPSPADAQRLPEVDDWTGGRSCDASMTCDVGEPLGLFFGLSCPYGYTCSNVANPSFEMMSFDHIGSAVLTILTAVTTESFPSLLYATSSATTKMSGFLFGIVLIAVGTLFIVNLLAALIAVEFEAQHKKEMKATLIVPQPPIQATFVEWLCVSVARFKEARTVRHLHVLRVMGDGDTALTQEQQLGAITLVERLRYFIFARIVSTRWFFYVTSICMMCCLTAIACDASAIPAALERTLDWINSSFTVVLTVEVVLRFLAADPFLFFVDMTNSVGVLALASFWATTIGVTNRFVRAARVILALKLLKCFRPIYEKLVAIVESFRASLLLLCVIALELCIFGCLGMQVVGGRSCITIEGSRFLGAVEAGQLGDASIWSRWDNFFVPVRNVDISVHDGGFATFLDFALLNASTAWWNNGSAFYVPSNASRATSDGSNYAIHSDVIPSLTVAVLPQASVLCTPQRLNFDSFGKALLTSFSILASDNWNELMYRALTTYESWIAITLIAALFVIQYYIGVYVVLNLFIAILISSTQNLFADPNDAVDNLPNLSVCGVVHHSPPPNNVSFVPIVQQHVGNVAEKTNNTTDENATPVSVANQADDEEVNARSGGSLSLFRWRLLCVLNHPVMNGAMILIVATSTAALAVETVTLPPDAAQYRILSFVDDVCSACFILEFCLRVFAKGPVATFGRRSVWNWTELLLVVCNVVDLVLSHAFRNQRNIAHIFRILYIMRPLRILHRTAGIRVVIRSLVGALHPLKDVVLVGLIVYVIAAIAGVQLFKDSLSACVNAPRPILTKAECLGSGYRWATTGRNFDHIGHALISLFVVSSLEQWQDVLFAAMDSASSSVAPQVLSVLYVLGFAVVGGFFFVSLFVSVLIRSYSREKARLHQASLFLTEEQIQWLAAHESVLASMPLSEFLYVPIDERSRMSVWNQIRARLIQLSLHPMLVRSMNITVVISMISSAAHHYPSSTEYDTIENVVNTIVGLIYVAEAAVKLLAFLPDLYFSSAWNRFDFLVMIFSLIDVILMHSPGMRTASGIARAFGVLRAVRLLRLAQSSRGLTRIVFTFTKCLYGLINVTAFLVLLIVSYALSSMWMFGKLYKDGVVLTVFRNFDTFVDATMVLTQLLFGGDWSIMAACGRSESTPNPNGIVFETFASCSREIGSCGNVWLAMLLFGTFFIFGRYVLLNIFVAVVLESFRDGSEPHRVCTITESDVRTFVETWVHFDQPRRMYIRVEDLLPMIEMLPDGHPFAPTQTMADPDDEASARQRYRNVVHRAFTKLTFLRELRVEERYGCVEFFDVLSSLLRHATSSETVDALVEPARMQFERTFRFRLECRVDPGEIAMAQATIARRLERAAGKLETTTARANKRDVIMYYSAVYIADMWKASRQLRRDLVEERSMKSANRDARMLDQRIKSNAPLRTGSIFWTKWRWIVGGAAHETAGRTSSRSPASPTAIALGASFLRPMRSEETEMTPRSSHAVVSRRSVEATPLNREVLDGDSPPPYQTVLDGATQEGRMRIPCRRYQAPSTPLSITKEESRILGSPLPKDASVNYNLSNTLTDAERSELL